MSPDATRTSTSSRPPTTTPTTSPGSRSTTPGTRSPSTRCGCRSSRTRPIRPPPSPGGPARWPRRTRPLDQGRTPGLGAAQGGAADVAHCSTLNSFGNADAADRLLGRNGCNFPGPHRIRFFPHDAPAENTVAAGGAAVSRTSSAPRATRPLSGSWTRRRAPVGSGWAWTAPRGRRPGRKTTPASRRRVRGRAGACPAPLSRRPSRSPRRPHQRRRPAGRRLDPRERSVNNTSLFIVLEVAATGLIFPGDAQEGAWQHVLRIRRGRCPRAAFYKVGHHGSHNATPRVRRGGAAGRRGTRCCRGPGEALEGRIPKRAPGGTATTTSTRSSARTPRRPSRAPSPCTVTWWSEIVFDLA